MANQKLSSAQCKMKRVFDRRTERWVFSVGDWVLALLPIVTSPLQFKFSGPYEVVKQVSELNYIISTPECRKKTRMCHVNRLKPYYACVSPDSHTAEAPVSPEGKRLVCSAGRVSTVHAPQIVEAEVENGLPVLDPTLVQGHLKNSESLCNLHVLLGHLSESKQADLSEVIELYPCLFGDNVDTFYRAQYRCGGCPANNTEILSCQVGPCLVFWCPSPITHPGSVPTFEK